MGNTEAWDSLLVILETLGKRVARLEDLEKERQDVAKWIKDLLPKEDKDGLHNYRLTIRDLNKEK